MSQTLTATTTPAASAADRRTYKGLHLGAGAIVLGALAVGFAFPAGASTHTVTGTVQLWQNTSAGEVDAPCTGSGSDADVKTGAQVRIDDAVGTPLATTKLGPGRSDGAACVFSFTVPDVATAGAYRVSVGAIDRPATALTYRELRADYWDVRVVLGA